MRRKAVKNKMRAEDRKRLFNKAAYSSEENTRLESIQKLTKVEHVHELMQVINQSPYKDVKAPAANKLADMFVFTSENDDAMDAKDCLPFIGAYSDVKQTRIAAIEKMELLMKTDPKWSYLLRRVAAMSEYDDTGILAVEKLKDSRRELELIIQRHMPHKQAVLKKAYELFLDRY